MFRLFVLAAVCVLWFPTTRDAKAQSPAQPKKVCICAVECECPPGSCLGHCGDRCKCDNCFGKNPVVTIKADVAAPVASAPQFVLKEKTWTGPLGRTHHTGQYEWVQVAKTAPALPTATRWCIDANGNFYECNQANRATAPCPNGRCPNVTIPAVKIAK
jgi:hypothetical protein